jgi:hypothetical protein
MTSVTQLLADYMEEHRGGGEADPDAFLERAAPDERAELAALIDAYLARAPRRAFDEAAFRDSSAEATVDGLQRAITGASGLWPVLLPRLRKRAGVKRRELVELLAKALGVGAQTDKVGRYYHQMEQGLLPAPGVSERVLDALAALVGSSGEMLRDAGRAVIGPVRGEAAPGPAFARMSDVEERALAAAPPTLASEEEAWDEVDELFRGGE